MTEDTSPLVSIIMSVRNSQATLQAALESIAQQTFTDWEFVICDDGSDDGTPEILARFSDEMGPDRVRLLTNAENRKLAYSLNRCLGVSRGRFIARMDGDDISEPDRLERQLRYLKERPDVDLVGTAMRRFNDQGTGEVIYPAADRPDRLILGRTSIAPFFHATVLARRSVFSIVGNYTVAWRTERAEDLDLWFKFFAAGLIGHNIREPLYRVREDQAAVRRRTPRSRLQSFATRWHGNRLLGYPPAAYAVSTLEALKILLPYRAYDLHRMWTRRRGTSTTGGRAAG